MKKLMLATVMFFCVNTYSQISNLPDLLKLSKLTVYGLTNTLQGSWKIERPTENYSKNGKTIIGVYAYSYNDDFHDQTLQRVITMATEFDYKSERTNFICNDKELLKSIKKNLPYKGFELKQNKPFYKFYNDGRSSVAIVESSTEEQKLLPGFYMVSVFLH